MVTTFLPAASFSEVWQLRTASPFRCTVHAPQSPAPQPNFVPVICRRSRKYHSSGISGSPSNWRVAPFTWSRIMLGIPSGGHSTPWDGLFSPQRHKEHKGVVRTACGSRWVLHFEEGNSSATADGSDNIFLF